MNFKDNIRINRTKMLDEAAINHRPTHFIHTFLIFLLVYGIVSLAREVLTTIPATIYLLMEEGFWDMMAGYISGSIDESQMNEMVNALVNNMPWYVWLISIMSAGLLIVGAIVYCKKFEKRPVKTLGFRKSNIVLEYSMGAIIGIAMYSLVLLIAYLTGAVTIEAGGGHIGIILLFLVAFIIQGAGEEVFIRGYLMTSVARDYKVSLALIFSSAVFSLIHGMNEGVTIVALINIFLFGVFEGIYVLKRGDIWGACAIHSMWNFVQGNIFGSSVSGMSTMPSLLVTVSNSSMVAANGGDFGLEGGFATTIVVLVAIGILMLIPPKKSELPDYELNREGSTEDYSSQF